MQKGSPVTAVIAATALAVGTLSAVGGILNERAADRKVCQVTLHENADLRGLVDDFILQNPKVTPAQKASADAIALARFPDRC
jgi:hypothetical protein